MSEPNWFLFYRTVEGSRPEFGEVLVVDSSVFRRTGRSHRNGTSTRTECGSAKDALHQAKLECEAFVRDGFGAARAWRFEPNVFDFDLLAEELLNAVKVKFERMSAANPGLNAFALATLKDASAISAFAHRFPSLADAEDELLWNTPRWSVSDLGIEFDIASRLLLSQSRDGLSRVEFKRFHDGFTQIAIGTLEKLRREGFFGSREFVLLFDVLDSSGFDDSVLSRLNEHALSVRYRSWSAHR